MTYIAPNVPTPEPVTPSGEITDLMGDMANKMGYPELGDISRLRSNIYSQVSDLYSNYPTDKAEYRQSVIEGEKGEPLRKLQSYRSQVVQQMFTDPAANLADIADPESSNYIANPYSRMKVAGERQAIIAKKLDSIKAQIEKENGTIDDIVEAWADEYESDILSKKLDLEQLDTVYNWAWKMYEAEEDKRRWEEEMALKREEKKAEEVAPENLELYFDILETQGIEGLQKLTTQEMREKITEEYRKQTGKRVLTAKKLEKVEAYNNAINRMHEALEVLDRTTTASGPTQSFARRIREKVGLVSQDSIDLERFISDINAREVFGDAGKQLTEVEKDLLKGKILELGMDESVLKQRILVGLSVAESRIGAITGEKWLDTGEEEER